MHSGRIPEFVQTLIHVHRSNYFLIESDGAGDAHIREAKGNFTFGRAGWAANISAVLGVKSKRSIFSAVLLVDAGELDMLAGTQGVKYFSGGAWVVKAECG